MKRLCFQESWLTLSNYQLFGLTDLNKLAIQWPQKAEEDDYLTGLPNRQLFDKAVNLAISEAGKQHAGLGVIMLDLDNFKKVNDTYGHLIGDEVLKEFAQRARAVLRDTDFLARYGGEEFAVLTSCFENSFEIGERIRLSVCSKPFYFNNLEINVTCSFGCAVYPVDGSTFIDVVKKADEALYIAKSKGRNQGVKSTNK